MKIKLIIISIILLLVMVFASGCIPFMEKLGLVSPTDEEQFTPEKGGPPDGLVKVLIGFREKPGAAQQAMVRGVGGKIKYTYNIIPAIAASVPEVAIEALKKNPNIRYIEPDGIVQALDAELDNSWGVKHIGAGIVHSEGNNGDGIKIAVIDTGIDRDHTDLAIDIYGVNFVSKPSWKVPDPDKWDDDNGHGTHVAGIIAALDNGSGVVGVAPGAELYALKVLDRTGKGDYSDVIAALEWCTANGIQVTNNSYGSSIDPGEVDPGESLEDAFDNASGILHVAAAGNGGSVIFPAAYESVIAVSATEENDELAWFSSTGSQVELAAPGVDIYSTYKDGGYTTYSGTSMASPHVAGVVALMIVANVSVSDIRGQLWSTADDLGDPGRDPQYGFGLVDANEAAGVPSTPPNDTPTVSITSPTDSETFGSGATISFSGTASDTEDGDLTDSLVWTSTIDDQIGTGGSFSSETLSDGTHTITANVTDSGGKTGSDSISITVGTPITDNMHVKSIEMSLKIAGINVNAIATVTIVDADGNLEGATVFGQWSGATNDTDSGVTDSNGQVSLKSDKVKNPESVPIFTFCVDSVIKDGWTFVPSDDEDCSISE